MTLSPTVKDRLVDKFLAIQQWAWRGQRIAMAGNMEKVEWTGKRIESILAELGTLIEGLKRKEEIE